uniref:uncharacterized protein LOC120342647 n=1 Tax=Styela clava TaxID=7725 RepID=UPI00193A5634|nr:uncharacterized protein LOC120342647 [Styela clava]XP_039267501.1 uncharacterized protein LOC120342647 [Styela clava]
MKYGCGLVYPIANYVFPKSDVDSVYDAVARGLESTQSGPVDDLSELQVEGLMWYLHLLHMQVVQHDPTKSKPIYQAVAKIFDDYKKMYPEFVLPRIIEIFGKETRKYVKVFSESFPEKRKLAEFHEKIIVPNVIKHFEEIGDAKVNEWMAKRFWGLHEVNRAFEEWLTRGKNNYADWTLTKLAEDMRDPIEKAWKNGDLGAYSPKYCEHHLCAKNLCNLHGSLKLAKSETQHQEL